MDIIVIACRALASKPRLELLRTLHEQPGRGVQALAAATGLSVPVTSKQIKLLADLHLIQATPSGREVHVTPPSAGSSTHDGIQTLQGVLADLFGSRALSRTAAQVNDPGVGEIASWDAAFAAMIKNFTAYTQLRRVLIVQWLSRRGPSDAGQIIAGIGLSADAARRQLDKLQRRGLIASDSSAKRVWTLIRDGHPPMRRRLLEMVLRAGAAG